jgi:uncharacterized membrane protein
MRSTTVAAAALSIAGLALIRHAAAQSATIELLPDLPGGPLVFFPYAMSQNADTVVGFSSLDDGYEAVVWRRGAGTIGLGDLEGAGTKSAAWAVSADGSVIAGTGYKAIPGVGDRSRGFRWTAQSGLVELPLMPEFDQQASSFVYDITPDGQTIVGECGILGFGSDTYACWWTGEEARGQVRYEGRGVSADGTIMTGSGSGEGGWSQAWVGHVGQNDRTFLGKIAGAATPYSQPWTISSDGSTIVGTCNAKGPDGEPAEHTFRWRADTGMIDLGVLPDGVTWAANPYAVNGDGSIVLGNAYCGQCPEVGKAYIWDEEHGMRDLNTVVAQDYGLDLGGLHLLFASAVSDDGSWIAGEARTPEKDYPAFLLHLTAHCPADCNGDGELSLFDFLCFTNGFNAQDPGADCDGNAAFDLFDFLCFTNTFNAGC